MRLVATQAKKTKKYLTQASNIILEAIKLNDLYNLEIKLYRKLQDMIPVALEIVEELAEYEAEYSHRKMKKLPNVKPLSSFQIRNTLDLLTVNTSVKAPKRTILQVYKEFVNQKTKQYAQIIKDAEIANDFSQVEDKVKEITNGLFSTQNTSLAKLVIVATANAVRNRIIINANLS